MSEPANASIKHNELSTLALDVTFANLVSSGPGKDVLPTADVAINFDFEVRFSDVDMGDPEETEEDTLGLDPELMTFEDVSLQQQGLAAEGDNVTMSGKVEITLPTEQCYDVGVWELLFFAITISLPFLCI